MSGKRKYVFDGEALDGKYTVVTYVNNSEREIARYDEITEEEYDRLSASSKRDIERWRKEKLLSIQTVPDPPPAAEAPPVAAPAKAGKSGKE